MFKQRERTRDREEGLVLMVREGKGERKSTKKQRPSGRKDKTDSRIYRWKKVGYVFLERMGEKTLYRVFVIDSYLLSQTQT